MALVSRFMARRKRYPHLIEQQRQVESHSRSPPNPARCLRRADMLDYFQNLLLPLSDLKDRTDIL
jgi:hypothetical protein